MKNEQFRYSGPPTAHQWYMTDFLVRCPKCANAAEVTVDDSYFQNNGKLYCSNCSHLEFAKDLIRYNVTIIRNCDNCGKHLEKVIPNLKEKLMKSPLHALIVV